MHNFIHSICGKPLSARVGDRPESLIWRGFAGCPNENAAAGSMTATEEAVRMPNDPKLFMSTR